MMKFGRFPTAKDRLKRLAEDIEALAHKDEEKVRQAHEVAELRCVAARELHSICADFVKSVNRLLSRPMVELGPPEYAAETFRDPGQNVFQINVAGRMLHIEFQATDTPTSTDKFRTPYILHGEVRCLNQESLDRAVIPELLLFCCVEKEKHVWILFDPRTHRTTPFDKNHLIALMERLV